MIFLNPAVLFGLLAASIPVIIHLFNLRKLKKIEFSTLAFLKELQKNKIRKIKIKQWILLALRVVIILFAVMAFARPALQSIQIGGTTSAAKTSVIFILDDTFSMSVVDQNGSYFNQAKEIISQVIAQLQEGDEAAIIMVSDPSMEIMPTSNLSDFMKNVNEKELSFASGDLNSALTKAAGLIYESKNFNKEIYILSDFQKGRIATESTGDDLSELLNESVRLYSFDFSDKEIFNISIDELKVNNQIFEKDKPVGFSITLTNHSVQVVSSAVVSLFINNKRSAQKSFDIEAGGSSVIEIETTMDSTGLIGVAAQIETDEIEQDNTRYFSLFVPDKISVGMFAENPDDLAFVDLALRTAGEGRYSIERKNIRQLLSRQLSKYQTIIVSANTISNGVTELKKFIEDGGGMLYIPASVPDPLKVNQVLSLLGATADAAFAGKPGGSDLKIKFDRTDLKHPVFENIFKSDDKKTFESPEINAYYKTLSAGNRIISLSDGSAFLTEYKSGKGKLFTLNIAAVLEWSDFPVKSIFSPFINKAVLYLSSKERDPNSFLAGEEVSINLEQKNIYQVKIIRPDNTEEFINFDGDGGKDYLSYSNTDIAGNYRFYSGAALIEEIAVNTDPAESKTEYADAAEFENYLKDIQFKGKLIPVSKEENIVEKIIQSRFGSELWRYFLLFAVVLALIEMIISRNARKDLEGLTS